MAQKIEVTITSDLSGDPGAHSVMVGLDGNAIELDLTETEHIALRDSLAVYFEKGHKVAAPTGKRGPGRPRSAAKAASSATDAAVSGGSGLTKEDRQAVREYAAANGHTLAKRGRLPELAITAWRDQNPEILSHLAA
jgi:hypothetical protein